jgi:D-alanyl-D-alanine carboxypeptidase
MNHDRSGMLHSGWRGAEMKAFSDRSCPVRRAEPVRPAQLASVLALMSMVLLAACGQPGGYGRTEIGAAGYQSQSFAPMHYYPPPGPPDDPWGPYIREAAVRYSVPEQWVRAVMQQESGGQEQAVSPVGAMGLMQVMPETYEGLRQRYGLGDDPYDPHNNILAGTAYIREMYDRFGAPAFLAAYNAGPDRVDAYLAGASSLPDETVNYLAAVTPNLGNAVPLSGPLATYAFAGRGRAHRGGPDAQSLAAGCDLSAAYDPNHPCTSLMRAATAPAPVRQALASQTGVGGCDLSAAYDPDHPCTSAGQTAVMPAPAYSAPPQPAPLQPPVQTAAVGGCDLSAAYDPSHPCTTQGGAMVASAAPPPPAAAPAALPAMAEAEPIAVGGCDPSAAYDPNHRCRPRPRVAPGTQLASAAGCDPNAAFDPDNPCREAVSAARRRVSASAGERAVDAVNELAGFRSAAAQTAPFALAPRAAAAHRLAIPDRVWGIQVGAFASPALARAVAEGARAQSPGQLHAAAVALPPVASGAAVLYRARLVNISESAAANACTNLNRRGLPCVVVQPSRS